MNNINTLIKDGALFNRGDLVEFIEVVSEAYFHKISNGTLGIVRGCEYNYVSVCWNNSKIIQFCNIDNVKLKFSKDSDEDKILGI